MFGMWAGGFEANASGERTIGGGYLRETDGLEGDGLEEDVWLDLVTRDVVREGRSGVYGSNIGARIC